MRASSLLLAAALALSAQQAAFAQGLFDDSEARRRIDTLRQQMDANQRAIDERLAKIEATNAGADDAIMLDATGHVAEATGMNLFVWKHETLHTPAVYAGLLRGVTRDTILEIAIEAGYLVNETLLSRYDLYTAEEAFLTGTAAEVAPIRMVDGRIIGAGKAGPITRDLRTRFQQLVRR